MFSQKTQTTQDSFSCVLQKDRVAWLVEELHCGGTEAWLTGRTLLTLVCTVPPAAILIDGFVSE